MQQADEIIGRIAQAEAADGRVGQAALLFPVAAGHGGLRRFGVEVLVEIPRGAAVDFQQTLAGAGFAVVLLGQGHSGAGGQLFDGLDIAEVIVLAHKADDVARCAAAEAVKALGVRVNDEGRRFFVMEGAQSGGGAPAAAQLHILADDLFNIIAPHDFLYVFLGDHGLTAVLLTGAGERRINNRVNHRDKSPFSLWRNQLSLASCFIIVKS